MIKKWAVGFIPIGALIGLALASILFGAWVMVVPPIFFFLVVLPYLLGDAEIESRKSKARRQADYAKYEAQRRGRLNMKKNMSK